MGLLIKELELYFFLHGPESVDQSSTSALMATLPKEAPLNIYHHHHHILFIAGLSSCCGRDETHKTAELEKNYCRMWLVTIIFEQSHSTTWSTDCYDCIHYY